MKSGKIRIGAGANIDQGTVLAYLSGRAPDLDTLSIGENATVRTGTTIYAGTVIGDNLETGHNVVIREENRIGNDLEIWSNSIIDYGCVIGNNVLIHNLVYIAQHTIIENNVFLAPGAMIANDKYPINKAGLKGPTIRGGSVIGMNATIMPGIVIGENAVIGSGSVVTRDVLANSVVCGIPARRIGMKEDVYSREQ
ncbi:MAG: acyltransferase [Thermodesulfobacteriota bacterium]